MFVQLVTRPSLNRRSLTKREISNANEIGIITRYVTPFHRLDNTRPVYVSETVKVKFSDRLFDYLKIRDFKQIFFRICKILWS